MENEVAWLVCPVLWLFSELGYCALQLRLPICLPELEKGLPVSADIELLKAGPLTSPKELINRNIKTIAEYPEEEDGRKVKIIRTFLIETRRPPRMWLGGRTGRNSATLSLMLRAPMWPRPR
ncbi:unnamed protein product [Caretta caretta]